MAKSPEAFRTISEVGELLGVPAHVLRFWETRFPQIRPVKRAGGRRYYRPADVALLAGLRVILHDQNTPIRDVQKLLREQGVRHICAMADGALLREANGDWTPDDPNLEEELAPPPRRTPIKVIRWSPDAESQGADSDYENKSFESVDWQAASPVVAAQISTAFANRGPVILPESAIDSGEMPLVAPVALPRGADGGIKIYSLLHRLIGLHNRAEPLEALIPLALRLQALRFRMGQSGRSEKTFCE